MGDLLSAIKTVLPNTFGSVNMDELSLHSVCNGVETSYNSWDPLTVLGENGKTGPNPLIIKTLNDMKIASTRTSVTDDHNDIEKKVTFEKSVLDALKSLEATTKNFEISIKNLEISTKSQAKAIETIFSDYIKKFYYTNESRTKVSKRNQNFKNALLSYYYHIHVNYYGFHVRVDEIKCMISGISLPSKVINAVHLFKSCWASYSEERLDFSDINDPRNGLLMFKPFEYAFDNSHICFQYDSTTGLFKLKILYSELKNMTIKEYVQRQDEIDKRTLLKSKDDLLNEMKVQGMDIVCATTVVDNLLEILHKPFSDFEGNYVLSGLDSKTKCFGRCLSFQASMAQHMALKKGWITADEISSPMVSESNEKKRDQILAWVATLPQQEDLPTFPIDD